MTVVAELHKNMTVSIYMVYDMYVELGRLAR